MAACTQDTVLLPATILENLRFGAPEATEGQIQSVCEALGIQRKSMRCRKNMIPCCTIWGSPFPWGSGNESPWHGRC